MPALFLGHGNPMNALARNRWTEAWRQLPSSMPKPRAILAISAHWYLPGPRLTASPRPPTIHDFGGFPKALYEVRYPAPGAPEVAREVEGLLAPARVGLDEERGLDHGVWSVLVHMVPDASIPVVQLAIDETLSAEEHERLARRLKPLRAAGVLVLGSGNVVHNLHAYAWGRQAVEPFDWAMRFESKLRRLLEARDLAAVTRYEDLGRDAELAAPTPEHFLPLLYVLAQHEEGEPIEVPVEGFDGGSVSMLGVRVG